MKNLLTKNRTTFTFAVLVLFVLTAIVAEYSTIPYADTPTFVESGEVMQPNCYDFDNMSCNLQVSVSAKSAILCTSNGIVLYEKQSDVPLPMASITKLMTAVVALEMIDDLSKIIEVSPLSVGVEGSSIYLSAGEKISYETLLYAIMLESANDAASAIAIALLADEATFVDAMNSKAGELNMTSTSFENPHGLHNDNHYTTVRDYARLMAHALKNQILCKIINTKKFVAADSTRVFTNHNKLLMTYKGIIGGKTGYTKTSGRTLVNAAEKNGVTLICVTINAPDDWNDHITLFNAGFSVTKSAVFSNENCAKSISVVGNNTEIALKMKDQVNVTTMGGDTVETKYFLPVFLYPPVKSGDKIGYVKFYVNGIECGGQALYATENVDLSDSRKIGFFEGIKTKIKSIFNS